MAVTCLRAHGIHTRGEVSGDDAAVDDGEDGPRGAGPARSDEPCDEPRPVLLLQIPDSTERHWWQLFRFCHHRLLLGTSTLCHLAIISPCSVLRDHRLRRCAQSRLPRRCSGIDDLSQSSGNAGLIRLVRKILYRPHRFVQSILSRHKLRVCASLRNNTLLKYNDFIRRCHCR